MIDQKIKKSCDQILPTEIEKQRMLAHILHPKKKRGFQKIWIFGTCLTTAAVAIFFFTISHPTTSEPNGVSIMRLADYNTVEYKGECYQYVGNYHEKDLKRTKEQILGGIVYQIKSQKDAIVIYQNGEYQHYLKCKGE